MDGTGKSFTVTKDFATYTGKEGACFVIIRARLQILPRTTRSADIFLTETLGVAIARLHEILTGAEKPLGVTLLDQASATYTGLSTKYTLIVEWEGERGVARHEQYASIISKLALVKRRVGEQRYILEDDGTASHETLEQALRWCADKSLPVFTNAGMAIIHPFFTRDGANLREEWAKYLVSLGGSPNGDAGWGLCKKAYVPAELKTTLRQLKERHDYNNILARGKLAEYV
jgi:FAD/FMN-containing dehydrogenase